MVRHVIYLWPLNSGNRFRDHISKQRQSVFLPFATTFNRALLTVALISIPPRTRKVISTTLLEFGD